MILSIPNLVLTCLFICGVRATTRKDKIFGFVESLTTRYGENTFVLADVVAECLICMSSLYGFLAYYVLAGQIPSLDSYSAVLLCCLSASTSIELILSYLNTCERKLQYFNKELKAIKIIEKLVQALSKIAYVSLICSFIIDDCNLELVLFIVCLAGLTSLVEYLVVMTSSVVEVAKNIEAQSDVIENCTTHILDSPKK